MNTISSLGVHTAALQNERQNQFSIGNTAPAQKELSTGSVNGLGGLANRQIRVGDGRQRSQAAQFADQATSFFTSAPKKIAVALGVLVAAVPVGIALAAARGIALLPRLINERILEPRADKRFEDAHSETLAKIQTPMKHGIASNPDVMDRLYAHEKASKENAGKAPMDGDTLRNLVASGERIAHALSSQSTLDARTIGTQAATQTGIGSPIQLDVDGEHVEVASSAYTTRALSWYMLAAAAQQDLVRTQSGDQSNTTDMTHSGAFVMKDPDNAIYRFLSAEPTAASRMSTHFQERAGHTEEHRIAGLFPSGKPSQRGIEDYRNMLPSPGGSLLFDKLTAKNGDKELFIKFESVGCPPYFKTEPHQSAGHGIARFFAALDRNIMHGANFLDSLKATHGTAAGTRQEHVAKGVLKQTIAKPLSDLVQTAVRNGTISTDAKAFASSVKHFGLPYVHDALDEIQDAATKHDDLTVLAQVMTLRGTIAAESTRLGLASDHLGIERRGAEVHISLNPEDNVQPTLSGTLVPTARANVEQELLTIPPENEYLNQKFEFKDGTPPQPICEQFGRDASRSVLELGGDRYHRCADLNKDAREAAQLLRDFAGSDDMAMLLSQYANQAILAPLSSAMASADLPIPHAGGNVVNLLGGHSLQTNSFMKGPDGGFLLSVRYVQSDIDNALVRRADGEMAMQAMDPANTRMAYTFSLYVKPEGTAEMVEPLKYEGQLRSAIAQE